MSCKLCVVMCLVSCVVGLMLYFVYLVRFSVSCDVCVGCVVCCNHG